eukprot:1953856-Rhodomonas_salina.1
MHTRARTCASGRRSSRRACAAWSSGLHGSCARWSVLCPRAITQSAIEWIEWIRRDCSPSNPLHLTLCGRSPNGAAWPQ